MTKEQFLRQLESALKKLPKAEREDILQDYSEHFSIGMEEGKTEEEIASALGSPHQIAKELLATYHVEKVEATATTGNILRAIWAVIGLGFFNSGIRPRTLHCFSGSDRCRLGGWHHIDRFPNIRSDQ